MGVVLDPERLKREMVLRGWSQTELAHRARVSMPTITAAVQGRSVSPYTLGRIAKVLAETPPIDGMADLIRSQAA